MNFKKIISLLLSAMLIIWLMPFSVYANEAEVDSAEEFLSAIESGEKNIKITGSFTLARQKSGLSQTLSQNGDFIPVIIPDGTEIYGTDPYTQVIGLRFPVQLAGNVVIENVGLNFSNTADYQRTIFMGGHILTLNNIKSDGAYDFSIYAGSFDFASDAPSTGNAAQLIINAPNSGTAAAPDPNINNVYLSSADSQPTFKAYSGTSAMTVSQKTKISQVYAEGADITVNGSGFQAATTNYITDDDTTLTLESGVTQHLSGGLFKEIVLPSGSYLELTEMDSSLVSITRLTGGGTVIRDNSGIAGIQTYSGETTVRHTSPTDGAEIFQTDQIPDDTDKFTLDSANQNAGYELKYENGSLFLAEKNTSGIFENIPYIDADGTEKICPSATAVTDSNTFVYLGSDDGSEYWYAVKGNITIDGSLGIGSDVHIILTDGCTLTVKCGTNVDYEGSLTIYGQSGCTGIFRSSDTDGYSSGIGSWDISSITINGGIIYADGFFDASGIGGQDCSVTVNGGTVYAASGSADYTESGAGIGGWYGEASGTFTVNGGFISAKSYRGDGYHIQDKSYKTSASTKGIVFEDTVGTMYGNVTLRTDAEIKEGQTLTIEEGQTLTVAEGVTLTNNGTIVNRGTIVNNGTIIPELFNMVIDNPGEIIAGKPVKLTVTVTPGSEADIQLIWSSSNPGIAAVDADGILTPVRIGKTKITATTADGKHHASRTVQVTTKKPLILISNLNGKNEQKIDWWKSYSSQSMNLSVRKYNCENVAYYKWTSSNKRVSVGRNNTVINTGHFSRSAVLTLTAYDADGNVVTKGSIRVAFYKFDWQRDRLQTQSAVSDSYIYRDMTEQELNGTNENIFVSFFSYMRYFLEIIFTPILT